MLPDEKLSALVERHARIAAEMASMPNPDAYVRLSREYAELDPLVSRIQTYRRLTSDLEDAEALAAESDAEMAALAREERTRVMDQLAALEREIRLLLLPKDAADSGNVILEIRAGTGGSEAALFAGDLFRMYSRYADLRGWRVSVLSASEGEVGGYKEVIASISGEGAFARLKFESGVHRVQRVPETESQGRIHTSAATVAVLPEAEDVDVNVNEADLRIDVFRSSGAGGQHVNTTDSAVRITHLPTGIVVACQNERSQHKNRATAWAMLKARLYELELQKREEAAMAQAASKTDIGWGHQIRSYVLQPYQLVKDLRTGMESTSPQEVLDGELDGFMEAALAQRVESGPQAAAAEA